MKSSSEEMRSKLKAFKFDDADRRSRPGGLPLHSSSGGNSHPSHLRFASSVFEQETKLTEIMSHTGLIQNTDGRKVKARIDEFDLLGDLGNGTCGHVVKMRHRPTGQVIAVKQMRRTGDADENKRIIMDLDVVLKSHDCREIVLCLGAFITDSDVWICMELMSTCFDKLLKQLKAPIPEDICGKVAVATVKALNYLKERHGVIHRDVKPSNILLEASGRIKLCDFGISGRLVDSKAKTRSAGCAAYMAPERIDPPNPSQPDYDIRADVWSLGITLVELATGYFPYRDCKTDFEVLTKVLTDDPPLLPRNGGFSHEFRSFVKDCLMKNYNDRPKYKKLLTHSFILKYEASDVDVGAWYRSKTATESPPSHVSSSAEPVTFKPQPSPRVVRSSRRPPQSPGGGGGGGYPSAMTRFSPTTSSVPAFEHLPKHSPLYQHHHESRRYPSNGGTNSSSYSSSLLNNNNSTSAGGSSSRSPQYSSGPTSLPEVSSRSSSASSRYRESPRAPRKFDFTFPTTLYNSSSSSNSHHSKYPLETAPQQQQPSSSYLPHSYGSPSLEDRYSRSYNSRIHRPSLGGSEPPASSSVKQTPPPQQAGGGGGGNRSPSNERASGRSGPPSAAGSSSSGFSWRNILQSPMSLRRLRTSSTDRSSSFDTARRFQPSYRSWNNEKDNYFSSMKR